MTTHPTVVVSNWIMAHRLTAHQERKGVWASRVLPTVNGLRRQSGGERRTVVHRPSQDDGGRSQLGVFAKVGASASSSRGGGTRDKVGDTTVGRLFASLRQAGVI